MRPLFTALVVVLLGTVQAHGQDWQLAPAYGDRQLSAGFLPDPHLVRVVAGGDVDLSQVGYQGFISEAPDFDLWYKAGDEGLTITVENASGGTVLLVNDPRGHWHFRSSSGGSPPLIRFPTPPEGLYNIWVGSLRRGTYPSASLVITEFYPYPR
ncbi:hypothetical protein SAMN05920897_10120 [Alkalispirochaeta americana]|uniref:Pre-peptidase C-terminal domain-containing protein n=1 Tax=Alkalispirochaeta americana TaxID=159291 RepID=A0A1N6N483_9SPIO|nr:PPC domain-containing protein [Alkalispirochaeta americana]SIP86890.1 hypothetical protein SAMN05920897_10120 [Alkalispirochaeta americana]